jgi:hypothetical protein
MSSSVSSSIPITVVTQYGRLQGVTVARTEANKLYSLCEKVTTNDIVGNRDAGFYMDRNTCEQRIFRLVTQFILCDAAQKDFPASKPKPSACDPLFYLRLPCEDKPTGDTLVDKVNAWTLEFFKQYHPGIFFLSLGQISDLKNRLEEFFISKFVITETRIPQDYTDKELKILRTDRADMQTVLHMQPELRPPTISCHEYALLRIGEIGLTEYRIAQKNGQPELPYFLLQWGYATVISPRKDDLVLYYKEGKLQHSARYLSNGVVESKWGNSSPVSRKHPLELIPTAYDGNQIVFFRKVKQVTHLTMEQMMQKYAHLHAREIEQAFRNLMAKR